MSRAAPTAVIFSGFFILGNLIILWGLLLPDLAAELALSKSLSGLFFSLMSAGTILGAVLGGKYAQRFQFLKLFAVLALLSACWLLLISLVSDWRYLLLLITMIGMTYSIMFTIGHTLIARLFANRRAAMMGLMDFMFSLGTLTAPLWVVLLFRYLDDWRWPLRILAFCLIAIACYSYWAAARLPALAQPSRSGARSLSYTALLSQPLFLLLLLVMIGYGAAEWGQGNWFVSYAVTGLGLEAEQSRLLLAWFTGGMVLSRLGFALLLRWLNASQLLLLLGILTVSGALLVKLGATVTLLGVGNLLLGLGIGAIFPLMLATVMDLDSDNGPVLSGIASIGSAVGFQFAGLLTGLWAGQAGIVNAFWLVPLASFWLLLTLIVFCRLLAARVSRA
ncbi:MAG: MFS transporter [Alishewanella agri]|nr:MFS transporter [Alishewanella agri]